MAGRLQDCSDSRRGLMRKTDSPRIRADSRPFISLLGHHHQPAASATSGTCTITAAEIHALRPRGAIADSTK